MAEKIKVLFISQYFFPEAFRGNDIVFELVKRGYDVSVLTAKPNYPAGEILDGYATGKFMEEEIEGAKVYRVPIYPRGNGSLVPMILNYISFLVYAKKFLSKVSKFKYDVIFVQQLSPVTMALPALWLKKSKLNRNTPFLLWILDLWPESLIENSSIKKGPIINFLNRLVKRIYKKADVILVSSKGFTESVNEKLDKPKSIQYFPNWADSDLERNIEPGEQVKAKMPKVGFTITFTGNVGNSQDFETILAAAELTKDLPINWLIIGEGRKSEWVKSEIESKNLVNVFPLGRFPMETMNYFYSQSDALLLTLKDSVAFSRTLPAKVQAYLSSGKPILAAVNGDGKNLVDENKLGLAVHSGDSRGLADAAIKMANYSSEELKVMSKNCMDLYQKVFTKKAALDRLEFELQKVLK